MHLSFIRQCLYFAGKVKPLALYGYGCLMLLAIYGWSHLFLHGFSLKECGLNMVLTGLVVWFPLRRLAKGVELFSSMPSELNEACNQVWDGLDEKRQEALKEQLGVLIAQDAFKQESGTVPTFLPFAGSVLRFDQPFLRAHPRAVAGQVAVITLAGGQATRLKSLMPKGCMEVSPVFHRTLFEVQASYLKALQEEGQPISWAIMTSQANDTETRSYFIEKKYFGLDPDHVDFFLQGDLPLIDERGRYGIDAQGKLLSGPDGNGAVLHHLVRSAIWQKWKKRALEVVVILPIDNPLAYPFDSAFLQPVFDALEIAGSTAQGCDKLAIAAIAVEREHPEEKVGVFVNRLRSSGEDPGRYAVAEYSEIDPQQAQAKDEKGQLLYSLANCGLFAIPFAGIEYLAYQPLEKMPWHLARKEYLVGLKNVEFIKRERFIFDLLTLWPGELTLIVYPREWIFAPIKAIKDLETAARAWQRRDLMQLKGMVGESLPLKDAFELNAFAWSPKNLEAIRSQIDLAFVENPIKA